MTASTWQQIVNDAIAGNLRRSDAIAALSRMGISNPARLLPVAHTVHVSPSPLLPARADQWGRTFVDGWRPVR